MRTLALALVLALQQQPVPKGTISGVVLRTGTTRPVVGARVTLTRINPATGAAVPNSGAPNNVSTSGNGIDLPTLLTNPAPPPPPPPVPAVTTDREGKFAFPSLDAASYRLSVTLNGYVKQEFGQRIFPGQGTVLALTAGQSMKDLVIHLTATGNITGRIRDSQGQPATGVPVQVFRSSFNVLGQRILESAGATRTNDRGEYRLYWITPGRYYVAAGSPLGFLPGTRLAAGGGTVTPNETVETYLFTYYPGVPDLATASVVDVTSGSELNIDFLVLQELYKISGRVLSDATGRPPSAIRVTLAYALVTGGGGTSGYSVPYDADSGAFELRDILPGSYALQIAASNGLARVPLEVRNNIEGLNVRLTTGVPLQGRLLVEGQTDSPDKFRVQMRMGSGGVGSFGDSSFASMVVGADGTFRMDNVLPGNYRVGFAAANTFAVSPDYYIKDARFDQSDILERPLEVSSSMPRGGGVTIVLSPKVGEVSGGVLDDRQQPVAGVQAVLVPERRDRVDLYKAATTDQNGRFTIKAVAPGDYKLFSWDVLENYGYFDPELLKKSDLLGTKVHIDESSKVSVDAKVIATAR